MADHPLSPFTMRPEYLQFAPIPANKADRDFYLLVLGIMTKITEETPYEFTLASVCSKLEHFSQLPHFAYTYPGVVRAMDKSINKLFVEYSILRRLDHLRSSRLAKYAYLDHAPTKSTVATDTTSTLTLDSLPTEVKLLILDNLRDDGDWKAILKLRGVSKKWSQLANPYAAIPINSLDDQVHEIANSFYDSDSDDGREDNRQEDNRQEDDGQDNEWQEDEWQEVEWQEVEWQEVEWQEDEWRRDDGYWLGNPIHSVCYTLARPNSRPEWIRVLPETVRMAKYLPSTDWENTVETRERLFRAFLPVMSPIPWHIVVTIIEGIVPNIGGIRGFRAMYDVEKTMADAELAMILATCTGLEYIECHNETLCSFGHISREVLKYAARQAQMLAQPGQSGDQGVQVLGKLKELGITGTIHVRGITVSEVIDMVSLPRMQDLRLSGLRDRDLRDERRRGAGGPITILKPRNMNSLNLTFTDCHDFSDEGLATILAACPRTRTLFLEVADQETPACFTNALAKHGQNLEFLWLDTYSSGTGLDTDPDASERLLGALSTMRNLRELVICRGDFTTAEALGDTLPPALRMLWIIGHEEDIDINDRGDWCFNTPDGAELYALERHPNLPDLEKVEILPAFWKEDDPDGWHNLTSFPKEFRYLQILQRTAAE